MKTPTQAPRKQPGVHGSDLPQLSRNMAERKYSRFYRPSPPGARGSVAARASRVRP
jgi:hypothetical protein